MVDTSQPIYASSALLFVGSADVYTFFATGSDLLPVTAPGGTGTFKLYGLKDNYPSAATIKFTADLVDRDQLRRAGQRRAAIGAPSVAGDIVFYTTTIENATTPCADFSCEALRRDLYRRRRLRLERERQARQQREPDRRDARRPRDGAVHRRSAPLLRHDRRERGATSRRSAIREDFNNGIGQVGVRILSWREIR